MGKENDIFLKAAVDQVRMWLYLADKAEPVRIAKAWWAMKTHFTLAVVPWSTVKGPMGATITTLDMIGWNPITPTKWVDMKGATWKASTGACQTALVREIREQAAELIWWRAAAHRNGEGLQGGADLTLACKHVGWLRKKEMTSQANLLITILAGGI
jgi:hypothetical protein